MQTVVELPEFQRSSSALLSTIEKDGIISYLATRPNAGAIMRGTGGIRKLRWSTPGSGKRGGIRVIYYFYNESMPLFLLTVFGKSEKDNLTRSERSELAKLARILKSKYGTGNE